VGYDCGEMRFIKIFLKLLGEKPEVDRDKEIER
jgi:hypothetical protein